MLYSLSPQKAICSDICSPLIAFFNLLKENPRQLVESYSTHWKNLQDDTDYYYKVRKKFNTTQNPEDFLFLTRTCINGLIRFNKKGEFNSPLHLNRFGIFPEKLEKIIQDWSNKLVNYEFINCDYLDMLDRDFMKDDFIYMDPPYFGTKSIYSGGISFEKLCEQLEKLNSKGVKFALSYDGISDKDNTIELPKDLYIKHLYLSSGNSSYNRLFKGKLDVDVKESIYLNY